MANVSHKNLTGTDLHEPKGAATATANQVYVADGAASGAWADNPPLVAIYQQRETDGVDGTQPSTSGSWQTSLLSDEISDVDALGSLASNAVTMQAGTYLIEGWQVFAQPGVTAAAVRLRIQNTTDATEVGLGPSIVMPASVSEDNVINSIVVPVSGISVIASAKVYELQHWTNTTTALQPGDDAMSAGQEIYAELRFWKIK
jgi:hypothetical protein